MSAVKVPRSARCIADALEPMGWQCVGYTGGNHLKWQHPKVRRTLITSLSPSDGNAGKMAAKDARRILAQEGQANGA